MKRLLVTVVALAAALRVAAPAFAQVDGQVIYGSDDRIDVYQTQNAKLRSLADSTVALVQFVAAPCVRIAQIPVAVQEEHPTFRLVEHPEHQQVQRQCMPTADVALWNMGFLDADAAVRLSCGGTAIDVLGYGAGALQREGTPAAAIPMAMLATASYERKALTDSSPSTLAPGGRDATAGGTLA